MTTSFNDSNAMFTLAQQTEVPPSPHPTEASLIRHNNTVAGLVVLCQGLQTASGEGLINIDEEPWNALPREHTKPKARLFREEVLRRHEVFCHPPPKPRTKNWTVEKCQQWLDKNPISNHDEVEYLNSKIHEHKKVQEEANAARKREMDALERNWVGKYPYLRLIHCLVDDDSIKHAYLRRNDMNTSRLALDNRNSDVREPTVYELIAEKWNNPLFEPLTEALSDLHPDFEFSEKLTFDLVANMAKATPERVKDKLQSLNVSLTRVIAMWEQSGQGDGGKLLDEDDHENNDREDDLSGAGLFERNHGMLSCRSAFVSANQTYLLYYWELMNKHDLLRSSFQKLNDDTASTDGGMSVPSIGSTAHDRESRVGTRNGKYFDKLTSSIEALANKNLQAASIAAEEQKRDREQRNKALMWEMEEKQKDRKQRDDSANKDHHYQEKAELKRRLEDLFTEKRKVQRLEAEYTYGDSKNIGMALYYRKEAEQIQEHEQHLQQQLEQLIKQQETA